MSWFTIIVNLLKMDKPNIFVETGTYLGDGIERVKNDFKFIHSIELHEKWYNHAKDRFKNDNNVFLHLGDSGEVLCNLINEFNEPTLFYLDAHFSGGDTAFGKEDEKGIPLLRELKALGKRNYKDIIIIDDMRLMGKSDFSGLPNDPIYPLTHFDWAHVTVDKMLESYGRICQTYVPNDADRLIIVPN
jgi:hypothetical protein